MSELYENICSSCQENPWFQFGSLLKDFDYLKNQTIGEEQLWKILTIGCQWMTSGDIDYFIKTLKKEGGGEIKTEPLIDMVNKYLAPGQQPQQLVSHMRERYFAWVVDWNALKNKLLKG